MLTQEQEGEARKKAMFAKHVNRKIATAVEVEAEKGTEEGMKVLNEAVDFESKHRHLL